MAKIFYDTSHLLILVRQLHRRQGSLDVHWQPDPEAQNIVVTDSAALSNEWDCRHAQSASTTVGEVNVMARVACSSLGSLGVVDVWSPVKLPDSLFEKTLDLQTRGGFAGANAPLVLFGQKISCDSPVDRQSNKF
jgi:hypothetical protein